MRQPTLRGWLTVALATAGLGCATGAPKPKPAPVSDPTKVTIHGRAATRCSTVTPIAHATVGLYEGDTLLAQTNTSADGTFTLVAPRPARAPSGSPPALTLATGLTRSPIPNSDASEYEVNLNVSCQE